MRTLKRSLQTIRSKLKAKTYLKTLRNKLHSKFMKLRTLATRKKHVNSANTLRAKKILNNMKQKEKNLNAFINSL